MIQERVEKGGLASRQRSIYMILGIAGIILSLQLLDQLFLFLLIELFTAIRVFWISKCFAKPYSRHG
jgi:hypothetical protein